MNDTESPKNFQSRAVSVRMLPLGVTVLFLAAWQGAVRLSGSDLFPTPLEVFRGLAELASQGLLLKYIVASLFRVSWGFGLAVFVGVPLGLVLGWFPMAFAALNPFIQILKCSCSLKSRRKYHILFSHSPS